MSQPDIQPDTRQDIRRSVRALCGEFSPAYWRELDVRGEYPEAFVAALTRAGFLAALIPEEHGGAGLGLGDAAAILEEINHAGGNAAACHAQMYVMRTLLAHGSAEQKARYLPELAAGRLRLQAFAVTEPNSGSDTTAIETRAVRDGDRYIVNGRKIFISRVRQSDLMLLLARTTPRAELERRGAKKTDGLSVFLVDLRDAKGLEVRPIRTMLNHATNELLFDDVAVPAAQLIGQEGKGFSYILEAMNAERILVAAEALGDGRWLLDKAVAYAKERVVFGRPIGQNQGVQFPIAKAHAALAAAALMTERAAALHDAQAACAAEANLAKYLAAEAAWEAANVCLDTHGGAGFAEEYDVERKFREVRLFINAPISRNMVLSYIGQHVLGLPRSF